MSIKKSIDAIMNQTRDLACSAVPQPTAPPCAPSKAQYKSKLTMHILFTLKKPCICEKPLHRFTNMDIRTVFLKLQATKAKY
jgi:hypothetical protein